MDALHCYEKSIGIVKEGNIDAYIGLCVIYIQAGKRDAAEKTMASVFPLFKETPRYWAFREITGISAAGEAARAAVSEDAVNDEKKYLRDTFGIEEIGRGNGA